MMLKCLKHGGYWLTPGKTYDGEIYVDPYGTNTEKKYHWHWVITNDLGLRHAVEEQLFIPFDQWREEQIEKLGI